ncbi:MAG: tetratricopeptide repeat protein [bacterium]|nr:MAG: tetratricopeptide repeat protein [bacterium]
MKEQQRTPAPLLIIYTIFLLLHLIPLLREDPKLWGLDQWRYIAIPAVAIILVFALLVLLPGFRSVLVRVAGRIKVPNALRRTREGKIFGICITGVAATTLFWLLRSETHFLGDGYVWADHMQRDVIFNEPVTSWLYRGLFMLLNSSPQSFSISPINVAAAISVLSGLVFLVFAHKTVRLITKDTDRTTLILLALLSTGTMLLFFGYVEPYPPFAASVMAFIFIGIKYSKSGTSAVMAVAAFTVAILLHPSAVALLPGLIVIFLVRKYGAIPSKKYYTYVLLAIVIGLGALWTLQHLRAAGGFFYEKFVPLFPGPQRNRIAYPLFSLKTLFDSFNELVLVCPVAVFIFTGLMRSKTSRGSVTRSGSRGKEPRDSINKNTLVFLKTVTIFYVLEFLLLNKNIGVSRDWDLFSAMAIPLALLTVLILLERYARVPNILSVFVFAVIVVHTVPWIMLNADEERSRTRFIDLVDNGFWSDYARGYGYSSLGFYFKQRGDTQRMNAYTRAASEADPGNIRYTYNLATTYAGLGRNSEAVALYRRVIDRDPDYTEARNNLGVLLWKMGKLDLAEKELSEIVRLDSTYIMCFEPLASIYAWKGQIGNTITLYRKARDLGYDLSSYITELGTQLYGEGRIDESWTLFYEVYRNGNRDVALMNNLGVILCRQGRFEEALGIFNSAAGAHPHNPDIQLNLARTYYSIGDYQGAWRHVEAAKRLNVKVPETFMNDLRKATGQAAP